MLRAESVPAENSQKAPHSANFLNFTGNPWRFKRRGYAMRKEIEKDADSGENESISLRENLPGHEAGKEKFLE